MGNLFSQGEHICTIFETDDEQRAIAASYLADGLRAGERALYVGQSNEALEQFHRALKNVGVNAAAMLKSGALIESIHADAHLVDNRFDSERMLRLLNEAVEAALNGGFTGLRACGDMSWLLKEPEGAHQVLEYEALLNQFFQGVRGCAMCLYDRRRLPPDLLDHALATHSSVIVDGHHKTNPFYRPPAVAMKRAAKGSDFNWKLYALRQRSQ
jgi:hypothetical protein